MDDNHEGDGHGAERVVGEDGSGTRKPRWDDLSPEEVRVLGCLMEKEATVPDSYPLTSNSLRTACNQSTSRDPVVSYGDLEVERALTSLRARGLTRTVHSTSNRATKYRHVAPEVLDLQPGETALIAVLMLRGPQTVGELKTRCERQHAFESTDEVADALGALAARDAPLVRRLERQPGQKDARWIHLLAAAPRSGPTAPGSAADSAAARRADVADVSGSTDPYGEATAEFYDLLATAEWESFGLRLLDLLADVNPDAGPIVDLGAGTGIGLAYLEAAVPGVRIHAVEPSKAMRTALHARLADHPGLREVTTVDPRPFATAGLPDLACALLANAAFGHLTDGERDRLWRFIAERMPPGAPAVIDVLPPDRPIDLPPTRYRRLQVGDYVYEGWQEGEPADDRTMDWTMTYKVLDGDDVVSEYRVRSPWRCAGVDDIRDEIAPYGLTLVEHDGCVVITS